MDAEDIESWIYVTEHAFYQLNQLLSLLTVMKTSKNVNILKKSIAILNSLYRHKSFGSHSVTWDSVEENINIKFVPHTKMSYDKTSGTEHTTNFYGAFYFLEYKLSCIEKRRSDILYNVLFCDIWKKKYGFGMSLKDMTEFWVTLYLRCLCYSVISNTNNMYLP